MNRRDIIKSAGAMVASQAFLMATSEAQHSPDKSLADLEALIRQQAKAFAACNAAWDRCGEIATARLDGNLPCVRVQTGKLWRGRDDDGNEIYDPIYSYTNEGIEKSVQPHLDARLSMCGKNEQRKEEVRKNIESRVEEWKAELARLYDDRRQMEEDSGYASAKKAAHASSDAVLLAEEAILEFRPQTLAAAARQADWIVQAFDNDDQSWGLDDASHLIRALSSIASLIGPKN